MEQSPIYHAGKPITTEALRNRECCRPFADPRYRPPEPEEVAGLIELAGWSQREVALRAGVTARFGKGSTTVRKWKTPKSSSEYREIPYAAWRLLLLHAGIIELGEEDVQVLITQRGQSGEQL